MEDHISPLEIWQFFEKTSEELAFLIIPKISFYTKNTFDFKVFQWNIDNDIFYSELPVILSCKQNVVSFIYLQWHKTAIQITPLHGWLLALKNMLKKVNLKKKHLKQVTGPYVSPRLKRFSKPPPPESWGKCAL